MTANGRRRGRPSISSLKTCDKNFRLCVPRRPIMAPDRLENLCAPAAEWKGVGLLSCQIGSFRDPTCT